MRQRVEDTLKPSIKKLAEWFIDGLELDYHATINTRIVETEEDFEAVMEANIYKRRAQQKNGKKAQTRNSSSWKHAASLEDSSSSSSSSGSSDSEEGGNRKKKKKKNIMETKKTSNMIKEMEALVDELKKKGSKQGGF